MENTINKTLKDGDIIYQDGKTYWVIDVLETKIETREVIINSFFPLSITVKGFKTISK